MPSFPTYAIISALVGASTVRAHGHVKEVVINGASYQAYDPTTFPYMKVPPIVVGWSTQQTDNGFVGPSDFGSPDIICHRGAKPAGGSALVAAGDKIFIQWGDSWPTSHAGPVLDYLASCGDSDCSTVDKTALEFFKIDAVGLIDGSTSPAKWGSDELIANKNGWLVQIPENIAPGNYVLRHEIIALHSAGQENGAQNYPQCFNLQITGTGSDKPAGTLGTKLYNANDPGISINIYQKLSSYEIPGPAPIPGVVKLDQTTSAIVSSASAIVGSATAPPPAGPTTTRGSGSDNGTPVTTTTAAATTSKAPLPGSSTPASPAPTGKAPCPASLRKKLRRHARDVKK